MPLIAGAIALVCTNITSQNHQNACSKALEASTKSTQLYTYDQRAEDQFTLSAKENANSYLGNNGETVVVGAAIVYKDYRNKAVDVKLPNMGLCDKVTAHVSENKYSLGFNWRIW